MFFSFKPLLSQQFRTTLWKPRFTGPWGFVGRGWFVLHTGKHENHGSQEMRFSEKPLTRVSKRVPGAHGERGLERGWQKRLAKGWRKVGERLAKGWRRVGTGLAKGWRRVGGFPCTLQFRNSRGARLETWVCDSMEILKTIPLFLLHATCSNISRKSREPLEPRKLRDENFENNPPDQNNPLAVLRFVRGRKFWNSIIEKPLGVQQGSLCSEKFVVGIPYVSM